MFTNSYEVHFEGEPIGYTDDFYKAMEIGDEILETIKKYPKEKDEYQLLQIHCYHWFDKIFNPKKYRIVVWSEKENRYIVLTE